MEFGWRINQLSKKGGQILNDLYNRVDQADWDTMISEAFAKLPTPVQKKFIGQLLHNDVWDLNGKPDEKALKDYRLFVDGGSTE
jgi:glucose dehydrogenase